MKIIIGYRKRQKPIKEFEELGKAVEEFKKTIFESYIKSPMGKLSIWILDHLEKFLKKLNL